MKTDFASSFGINNRDIAWNWAVTWIRNNVCDKQWMHAQSLAEIADIFTRTFAMMGNCRSPLYFPRGKAEDWFDIWRLIDEQRVERNEWSFSGSSTERGPLHPTLALFRPVPERNHARSLRRFLRARYLNSRDDTADVWEHAVHHVEPSDDKSLPAEGQKATLNLPAYFSLPHIQP